MVIEKAKRIGKCLLLNLKDIFLSDGMRGMRGMRTAYKFNPSITLASMMCFCRRVIVNLVPPDKHIARQQQYLVFGT
jgi:hypothetical protein